MAMAGCEPVDDGAATRNTGWDGKTLTDHVLTGDREVFLDTDETVTVADGCAKTVIDAKKILSDNCGSCHDAGAASQGQPTFDFLMDDTQLKTQMWTRQGTVWHFVVPGQPDQSAVFFRAGVDQDMPPVYSDPTIPTKPRVTFSAISVLRQWIEKCM
jgi:hypothetical protein